MESGGRVDGWARGSVRGSRAAALLLCCFVVVGRIDESLAVCPVCLPPPEILQRRRRTRGMEERGEERASRVATWGESVAVVRDDR